MECKLIITNGLFKAEVHFRGGSIMDKSRRPASYATSRFIEQDIIENSAEFKCGKIVLLHEMEVPDDAEELARKASMHVATTEPQEVTETPTPVAETATVPESIAEEMNDTNPKSSTEEEGVEEVEVACKADAVEWLKEHCPTKGYNGNNLRSKEAFEAACKEANVRFVGI